MSRLSIRNNILTFVFTEVTPSHLWAREYPVSDAAEKATVSLRVAVNHLWGVGMGGLPWLLCYPATPPLGIAATRVSTPDIYQNQ